MTISRSINSRIGQPQMFACEIIFSSHPCGLQTIIFNFMTLRLSNSISLSLLFNRFATRIYDPPLRIYFYSIAIGNDCSPTGNRNIKLFFHSSLPHSLFFIVRYHEKSFNNCRRLEELIKIFKSLLHASQLHLNHLQLVGTWKFITSTTVESGVELLIEHQPSS